MSSLSKQEQLRQVIAEEQERIRQTFPAERDSAVVALTRAKDWRCLASQDTLNADSLYSAARTPHPHLFASGWHKTLQLCYGHDLASSTISPLMIDSTLDAWADQTLLACDRLSAAEQVLAYCETGFMRMQQSGQQDFYAWIADKRMPTEWRERADLAWWTNALAQNHQRETQELTVEKAAIQPQLETFAATWQADAPDMAERAIYRTTRDIDDYYTRLGMLRVKSMACHFLYPARTTICGCAAEAYVNALAALIGLALKHLDLYKAHVAQRPACSLRMLLAPPISIAALVENISAMPGIEQATIGHVVETFTLSHENAYFHCSAAGTPAPPLLRLDDQHLAWSLTGLLSEPFLFLARELKRRCSSEYHTASHVREEVFRQDLYHLFSDKRFVTSAGSLELRGVQGDLTTDVDALIFDRKAGALALFELKAQDPFAYSRQERIRQRDYFYNAGRQVLACAQWLNRNGANALLSRLDPKLVKRLKVQKTYIFVLGRYLAHFFDGPEFDRRAAWGTWSQVLRLMQDVSFAEDPNPIQSFYNKLVRDTPLLPSTPVLDMEKIAIGESIVRVYPDFQAYKSM
jgi:hypothetical protein